MLSREVSCLDDATVYRLVQGQLEVAELTAADRHLDSRRAPEAAARLSGPSL
jgi:hypothetical protein